MNSVLLLLLAGLWIATVTFLRYYRIWLPYYVVGVVGSAYAFVLVISKLFNLELGLAHSVASIVHFIAGLFGIETRIFEEAPGVLLVLVIVQEIGWTVLHVGIESSGLLEMSVFISLLLFYPAWTIRRRLVMVFFGVLATWLANVVRMLVIVLILHIFGKQSLVLAHTIVGKLVFALLTVGIYWYFVTLPTIRNLSQKWDQR